MTAGQTIEERLERLGKAIASDESLVENVMSRIDAKSIAKSSRDSKFGNVLISRRFTVKRFTKFAAAAALIIIALLLSTTFVGKLTTPAYAFDQTVEAFRNVRFMHILRRDEAGQIADERWIEIGPEGFQVRYRQDNPPNRLVVEDGQTVSVHYKDKNTIVLYDPKDKQYQRIGDLRGWLNELAGQDSLVIDENVDYRGRKAHHVRWLKLNQDCYVEVSLTLSFLMVLSWWTKDPEHHLLKNLSG